MYRRKYLMLLLALIFILPQHTLSQSAPVFTKLPSEETTVQLENELRLPCAADGSPKPKIVNWLKDNQPVDLTNNFLTLLGELVIQKTKKEDSGEYQCIAASNLGGVVSTKKKVHIAYFEQLLKPTEEYVSKKTNEYHIIKLPLFNCNPKPKILWKKNNQPVVESERLSINKDGDLYLTNLKSEDTGRYVLVLENTFLMNRKVQFASQEARIIQLTVLGTSDAKESKIIYSSPKQIVGEKKNEKIYLECFYSGQAVKDSSVIWKKYEEDGKLTVVQPSSKYKMLHNGRRLEITSPTFKEDSRKFQCLVIYYVTEQDSKDITLEVQTVPEFLQRPLSAVAYTDNSTVLNCSSSASPTHQRRWYRNGMPVPGSEVSGEYINKNLTLNKLNWEDNGIFQCAAENAAGLYFAQMELKVQNKSAEIINEFKNLFVGNSSTIKVPCVVIGAPKPVVFWQVNSTRIPKLSSKYEVLDNSTLIIKNIQYGDGGQYTCTASNGQIAEKSIIIKVVVPTRLVEGPEKETRVRKGAEARLPCNVSHDENIEIRQEWRQNGLPLSNYRYENQSDGSLLIRFAQQTDTEYEFSCHVFSKAGNITVSTSLVIVQLPLYPSAPRPTEVEAYSVRLTWDAPSDGGSPLTGYRLYMRNETMADFVLLVKLLPLSTSHLVEKLSAGSKFKFKVAAENKFGVGQISDETNWVQTQTLAPSASPSDFTAVSAEKDSVTLAWKLPPVETHNGPLKGFIIAYRVPGPFSFANIKLEGGYRTSYVMSGLPLSTAFEVHIAMYNDGGNSPWSKIIKIETKQGIPSAPPTNLSVSVLNDTSVLVSFTSPPQQLWNGNLKYILARTWPPGKYKDFTEYKTRYDTSSLIHQSFVLPDLRPDTEYSLAVAVATSGGPSDASDEVQFKTGEGVPDAVRNLVVAGIYADAFSVRWQPPSKPAGVIRGYRVRYRLYATRLIEDWKVFDEEPNAKGAVINNLLPRTRYEVGVAAFTSTGAGSYVGRSVLTIESPVLPSEPTDLKVYAVWGNNISLGWTPGDSGRAVIINYLIEYNNDTEYHFKEKDKIVWRTIRNLTKILENPANITNLKPSTAYRFRMRAFNRVGASPYSNVSNDILTSEGVPTKPPTQITVTSPERQRLLIRWVPPPRDSWNAGSIKYQFLVKPKGQNDLLIKTPYIELADTLAKSHTIGSLEKYIIYNITMRLFTDQGYGPWSEPVFAKTSEDYPAGAPTITLGRALNSESVLLEWGAVPEDKRNGNILGYIVYYMIMGFPETELFKRFPGNETFTGTITQLAGFTDYEFRMLAYTKVGGIYKGLPKIVKTLEGVPGIPQDIWFTEVNYGYVNVEWKKPIRPNGLITGYQVRYKRNDTKEDWKLYTDPIDPYLRLATIRGLSFNVYYLFEIRARTGAGWGTYAQEYVFITRERDVPESPILYFIPATSIRSKSIIIKWYPRYDWNSPIRAYNLQFNEAAVGWQTFKYGIPPVENIPATITEVEVTRLLPSTKYQFRVRAINDVGASQWSDISRIKQTNPQVPRGAPSNVRVTKMTSTSLFIAWEEPLYTGYAGELRGYTISYNLIGGISDVPTEINLPRSQTELQLSNLKVFSPYEVRIAAVSESNDPISTQPFEWRTGEEAPLDSPRNIQVSLLGGSKIRVTWDGPTDESVRGYKLGFKIETTRLGSVLRRRRRRKKRSIDTTQLHKHNPILRVRRDLLRQRRALTAICPALPVIQTHLAGPKSKEAIITNLPKYNRFKVSVRVYNSFADGPKSHTIGFSTPIDVPGPPYLLSQRVYSDLIDLDFDQPCNRNGYITGYKVEYRTRSAVNLIPREYNRNTRRIRISGLVRLTDYVLHLSAKTDVGYGQKVTIEFTTKGEPTVPKAPGRPEEYDTKSGILRLAWDERDNGFMPVEKFYLQYRIGNGNWLDLTTVESKEVQYDGSVVVYSVIGLKTDEVYRFRVKSQTALGVSPFSESSKPIRAVAALGSSTPFYKEIWFIFVMIIISLIIIIIILICCYKQRSKKASYKNVNQQQYNMSSFEMAMVTSDTSKGSKNGSIAPSVASQKKPLIKNEMLRSSSNTNSIAKSINPSDKEPDLSDDADIEARYNRNRNKPRDNDSIANHYSNDPFHKNWQDSMDKKTKKALLAEYKQKRAPSQASVDTLGEKKRSDSEEMLDRPRIRPGRRDMTERKKLTRSEPFLAEEEDQPHYPNSSRYQPPPVRRPGKKPIEKELTRSVPDINRVMRNDNQINRQPSFLRATTQNPRDSDVESLNDVLQREKSKRELAMELENRVDDYYPNAPPPYDYNGAPPAYTPSQQDDMSDGGHSSNYNYPPPTRPKPNYQPPGRISDHSDSSRQSSNRYPPSYLDQPDRGDGPGSGYYNPKKEYNAPPNVKYNPRPSTAQNNNRNFSNDMERSSNDGFAPPQNSRFDDEYDDDMDGYEPDMTLV